PIGRFTEWLGEFRQGLAALAKIVGLLEVPTRIAERPGAVELPREGVTALRGVTFGYAKRPVVRDLSLEIAPGEHIALVGATGAGTHRARRRRPARRNAGFSAPADRAAAAGGTSLHGHDRGQRPPGLPGGSRRGRPPRPTADRRTRPLRVAAGRAGDGCPDAGS